MAGNANSISSHNSLRGSLSENNLVSGTVGTAYNPTYAIATEAAAQIVLNINNADYKLYAELKDRNGNRISISNTIDLPLETMVVNGEYDESTKEVILTLDNGNEIKFSIADLISGLQSEITSVNMLSSDLVDDNNKVHKFVSTTEKTNWNNKLEQSDLATYVENTDYATTNTGGVIKVNSQGKATSISAGGTLQTEVKTYQEYGNLDNQAFIGKGTLENVITGKNLETTNNKVTLLSSSSTDTQYPSAKCVYDLVGDIETLLGGI